VVWRFSPPSSPPLRRFLDRFSPALELSTHYETLSLACPVRKGSLFRLVAAFPWHGTERHEEGEFTDLQFFRLEKQALGLWNRSLLWLFPFLFSSSSFSSSSSPSCFFFLLPFRFVILFMLRHEEGRLLLHGSLSSYGCGHLLFKGSI
jgi:hypothetical protein